MKEAYNYLSKFINKNDYVVIANSGGPDSMALLSLLIKYREKVPFNIVCAHVNHKVRLESDDEDARPARCGPRSACPAPPEAFPWFRWVLRQCSPQGAQAAPRKDIRARYNNFRCLCLCPLSAKAAPARNRLFRRCNIALLRQRRYTPFQASWLLRLLSCSTALTSAAGKGSYPLFWIRRHIRLFRRWFWQGLRRLKVFRRALR